jgi:hypothetical protein
MFGLFKKMTPDRFSEIALGEIARQIQIPKNWCFIFFQMRGA